MIDLHTHTIFSDGELIPSELVRRAVACGYTAIALTDHVDRSNIDFIIPKIVNVAGDINKYYDIAVIPGAEITHVPPESFGELVKEARELGAAIVLAHGETIVEPVIEGTNRAAIEAGVDILAHPGLISEDDLILAQKSGTTLEITARKGHSLTNGYVAGAALKFNIPLTVNTDSHSPGDLITREMAVRVLLGAGVPHKNIDNIFNHAHSLVSAAMDTR